jgi:SAM-dependent methyltransferase
MFFPHLIQSIKPSDRVLEIGPGGNPHPRSNIFLEHEFDSLDIAKAQRGYSPPLKTDKPIIYYKGSKFPFEDKEFDYVICSHVIEHVFELDKFIGELIRISKAGYLEYPTVYYDYIYNFPEHVTFPKYKDSKLFWMNKSETNLSEFQPIQSLFYESLWKEYYSLMRELKQFLFEGFEWFDSIDLVKTCDLQDLTFDAINIPFNISHSCKNKSYKFKILSRIKSLISKML